MNNQFYNPFMQMPIRNASFIPNATRAINPIMNGIAPTMARTSPLTSLLGARSATTPLSISSIATKGSFSWTGLLNGASKTLGVINQAIPVFYQVKPIVSNAKTMFRVAKEINSSNKTTTTNTQTQSNTTTETNNNISNNTSSNENEPQFFA